MPSVETCKRFEGSSTYKRDFGPLGSDPMQAATTVPAQLSLCATTRELNEGTTRSVRHTPGYTGFIPAASTNPHAVEQAAGCTCRPDAKVRVVCVAREVYDVDRLHQRTVVPLHLFCC